VKEQLSCLTSYQRLQNSCNHVEYIFSQLEQPRNVCHAT